MANIYTTNSTTYPSDDIITISGSGTGSAYILNTGAGSNGTWLTSGASVTGTTSWASPNTNFNDGSTPVMTIPHGSKTVEISEAATLDVKGNVVINGQDLEERLNIIETLLQIPTRDVTMETKHPKLKQLYEQYMHELAKYKTWDRIKGTEND